MNQDKSDAQYQLFKAMLNDARHDGSLPAEMSAHASYLLEYLEASE